MSIGQSQVQITLYSVPDLVPELAAWFFVNLTSVTAGAAIKKLESYCNVTMADSDFPAGRIGFHAKSR